MPPIPSHLYIYPAILNDYVDAVADFWRAHYCGPDWKLDPSPGVVEKMVKDYINDTSVYLFCLAEKASNNLVGTIVSTPLTGGLTILGPPVHYGQGFRVIEGLCVSSEYRKQGIAGLLIAYMDYFTSISGPVAHLWSREIPYAPLVSTALTVKKYAYVKADMVKPLHRSAEFYDRMPWDSFSALWTTSSTSFASDGPAVVAQAPANRRGDLRVYATKVTSAYEPQKIMILTDTRRVGGTDGKKIWEVVWCGHKHEGKLKPSRSLLDFQHLLNSLCAVELGGVLFACCDAGDEKLDAPWIVGRSGFHAWYMYNFVPPAFGSCELYAVREEL